jgi:hypothetical protein
MRLFRDRSTDDKLSQRLSAIPEAASEAVVVAEAPEGEGEEPSANEQDLEGPLFAILQRQKALQVRLAASAEELTKARERRRQLFLAGDPTVNIDVMLTRLERDVDDLTIGLEEVRAQIDASEKHLALMKLLDAQRDLWLSRKRQVEIGRATLDLRKEILEKAAEEESILAALLGKQAEVEKLGGPVSSWPRIGLLPDAVPDEATMEKMETNAFAALAEVEKALAALENPPSL